MIRLAVQTRRSGTHGEHDFANVLAGFHQRVRAVTLEEVNRVARERLDPAKLTIVKAGDFAGARN